ncbi:SDR family oxidoreductase [Plantibacter flavus]|uniref:SDR family oxidoreductase n=1 Tax=Plantibacter flavus TaxID=150123 RepID=UPI003F1871D3
MTTKRILFIGGSGIISSASVARSVALGHEVTVLNRGLSEVRPLPDEVEQLHADVRDADAVTEVLGSREFDVVAQFTAFTPEQVQLDIDRFAGSIGQYVFISSASAYQKPPSRLPVVESTPLRNPFSQYARDKTACEDVLVSAYREGAFPATIVRPSHTYDRTLIPTLGRRTDLERMRAGKPVVVHGDGTTPWTITHTEDFAVGFVGLLGRRDVLGEAFHITGQHAPSWNDITTWIADAAGVEANIVHVPSDLIAEIHPGFGASLLGDKAFPMVFDNTKIRSLVPEFHPTIPFWDGAAQMVEFHDANPRWQPAEPELDAAFDRMVAAVSHRS